MKWWVDAEKLGYDAVESLYAWLVLNLKVMGVNKVAANMRLLVDYKRVMSWCKFPQASAIFYTFYNFMVLIARRRRN